MGCGDNNLVSHDKNSRGFLSLRTTESLKKLLYRGLTSVCFRNITLTVVYKII